MILNSLKNYLDFKNVNSSIKYLSLVAFCTGLLISYFYTVLVILQKYAGYSEFIIGIVASFGPLGLIFAGFFATKLLKRFGFYKIIMERKRHRPMLDLPENNYKKNLIKNYLEEQIEL